MPPETVADLAKLKIDRGLAPIRARRRRRWLWRGALLLLVAAAGGWFMLQPKVVDVNTTPVVTSYPSQQFVVLNATGYVVAQRKAAIASKASGRLEWLGVAEGSRVKTGDVIARLDDRDVVAQAESAEANVRAAQRRARAGAGRGARRRAAARAQSRPRGQGIRRAGDRRHVEGARTIAPWPRWRMRGR